MSRFRQFVFKVQIFKEAISIFGKCKSSPNQLDGQEYLTHIERDPLNMSKNDQPRYGSKNPDPKPPMLGPREASLKRRACTSSQEDVTTTTTAAQVEMIFM